MQILITGGAGFIGSHSVAAALAAGHTVRVFDNLSSGDRANLPANVDLTVGDVTDPAAVDAAVAGCDAVLHLAALVSVPQSMREPEATFQINAAGTANVLDAARRAGVRRFVLASTCAVYGDLSGVHDETSPTQPLSPYAGSKLMAETWAGVYARAYGMQTVVLRYFNVYGPRQRADSPYSGVIARWCTAASAGAPCRIFGDGSQTRDFVSVHDVAAANLLALTLSPSHPYGHDISCPTRSPGATSTRWPRAAPSVSTNCWMTCKPPQATPSNASTNLRRGRHPALCRSQHALAGARVAATDATCAGTGRIAPPAWLEAPRRPKRSGPGRGAERRLERLCDQNACSALGWMRLASEVMKNISVAIE